MARQIGRPELTITSMGMRAKMPIEMFLALATDDHFRQAGFRVLLKPGMKQNN